MSSSSIGSSAIGGNGKSGGSTISHFVWSGVSESHI
jgi:hypothetical protein